jgi:hypothetical protein
LLAVARIKFRDSFFRQAPRKKVGYEAAIRVECAKFQSGSWYAVLMGQSGL